MLTWVAILLAGLAAGIILGILLSVFIVLVLVHTGEQAIGSLMGKWRPTQQPVQGHLFKRVV